MFETGHGEQLNFVNTILFHTFIIAHLAVQTRITTQKIEKLISVGGGGFGEKPKSVPYRSFSDYYLLSGDFLVEKNCSFNNQLSRDFVVAQ